MDVTLVKDWANLGMLPIFAWVIWHTFKVQLPDFRREIIEQGKQFSASLERQQTAFLRALAEERRETLEAFEGHRQAMSDDLRMLATAIDRLSVRATSAIDPKLGS